jgi:hypothetical protein
VKSRTAQTTPPFLSNSHDAKPQSLRNHTKKKG